MKMPARVLFLFLFFLCANVNSWCGNNDDYDLPISERHSCVVISGGHVRCWGSNVYGELGYEHTNHIGDDESPASSANVDLGMGMEARQIAMGYSHACALLADGAVRCWGRNERGQLGYGHTNNIGDDESPASAGNVSVGGAVKQIAVGGKHTCALLMSGNVRCWGDGSYIDDNVDLGMIADQITVGGGHTCALRTLDGAVRCWGRNDYGQLGYGHTNHIGDDESPASAGNVSVGGAVKQIVAGNLYTCALLTSEDVHCWGINTGGVLGYGHGSYIGDDESPVDAGNVNVGGTVTQITAGSDHTCALLTDGAVRCWGNNHYGQLGYGHTDDIGDDESPVDAGNVNVDVDRTITQIAVGQRHTCALLTDGAVRCWGRNKDGELGYGHTNDIGDDETPADAGDVDVGAPVIKLWGDLLR